MYHHHLLKEQKAETNQQQYTHHGFGKNDKWQVLVMLFIVGA
jgi:hypothetical protein